MTSSRTGGEILVANLLAQGATHAFAVPGESYLAVLDALYDVRDRLSLIVCRQEGGAAYMAEAYGKLTGRPGIAFVTRGPGATNAAIGVHAAAQDSTPMILFVGQVGGDFVDREAFQEIDYRRMFGSVAKWAAQIDRAERIPEYVAHAFRIAMSGRPGPVVLALPEDMLSARAEVSDAPRIDATGAAPGPALVAAAAERLAAAKRPLVIVGGSRWDAAACLALREAAEALALPVACGFRNQDLFDNRHPLLRRRRRYRHQPQARRARPRCRRAARDRRAAGRNDDVGLHAARAARPRAGADPRPPGRRRARPGLPARARDRRDARRVPRGATVVRVAYRRQARAPTRRPRTPTTSNGRRRVPCRERSTSGESCNGWTRACPTTRSSRTVPATIRRGCTASIAIAASARSSRRTWVRWATACRPRSRPRRYIRDRVVLSWNGDGCFLMNGQELATAVQYGLGVIFVVVDNGMYGTIRMHQERTYPGRVYGTALANPDFAALARAYGAHGETVVRTDEFAPAFERALAAGGPALLHLRLDPQALTMNASIDALRAQGAAGAG